MSQATEMMGVPNDNKMRARGRLATIVLATVVVLVGWRIVAESLGHLLTEQNPRTVLIFDGGSATAMQRLSDLRLEGLGGEPRNLTSSAALATVVLKAEPLEAEALRNLALAATATGSETGVAIIRRAGMRGYRDVATQATLLMGDLGARDFARAAIRLDVLLRLRPDLESRLFIVLDAMTGQPEAREAIAGRFAEHPAWRDSAMTYLSEHSGDLDALTALYQAVGRRSRLTNEEQAGLLNRLVKVGRYADAHRLWVSWLPAAADVREGLYNPRFLPEAGASPFNWGYATGDQIEARPVSGGGLVAGYNARAGAVMAEQLMLLSPGSWRLSQTLKIVQRANGAKVGFTLTCAAAPGARLADLRISGVGSEPMSTLVAVPASCPAAWLRLEGSGGEGFNDVSIAVTQVTLLKSS